MHIALIARSIMPFTFNYFNIPGRGEATRIALALAGVEFYDKRISFAEFQASPFSALPVLQVGLFYSSFVF